MRSLQPKKTGWRRIVYSKVFAGLLLCFACYMIVVVWGMYGHYRDTRQKVAVATAKTAEVSAKQTYLENQISSLETKTGKEAALRKKFMVVGKDEHVVVLVNKEQASSTKEEENTNQSWWSTFLSWF